MKPLNFTRAFWTELKELTGKEAFFNLTAEECEMCLLDGMTLVEVYRLQSEYYRIRGALDYKTSFLEFFEPEVDYVPIVTRMSEKAQSLYAECPSAIAWTDTYPELPKGNLDREEVLKIAGLEETVVENDLGYEHYLNEPHIAKLYAVRFEGAKDEAAEKCLEDTRTLHEILGADIRAKLVNWIVRE